MTAARVLDALVERGAMDVGWAEALRPVAEELAGLAAKLRLEQDEGRGYLPAEGDVLRAFRQPFSAVRVLIMGQDPYPTPGHPIGLSFATGREIRPLPRSLVNIYRELADDLHLRPAVHGDLTRWSEQGVLLLNRVLSVAPGAAGSHRGLGWQRVTDQAIRALAARDAPLVSILWGKDAQSISPLLGDASRIESPHPSPLSARKGFFGSRPFSRANAQLRELGADPIDWRVDDETRLDVADELHQEDPIDEERQP